MKLSLFGLLFLSRLNCIFGDVPGESSSGNFFSGAQTAKRGDFPQKKLSISGWVGEFPRKFFIVGGFPA